MAPRTRLTWEQVRQIRELAAAGRTRRALAARFGLSRGARLTSASLAAPRTRRSSTAPVL